MRPHLRTVRRAKTFARARPSARPRLSAARCRRARRQSRRAAAAMEESKPPSINDCLAQLRQCLDPRPPRPSPNSMWPSTRASTASRKLWKGPRPGSRSGRAFVRQVRRRGRGASPSPSEAGPEEESRGKKPAPPPPKSPGARASMCATPIIDAELTAAASKLQAAERGRAARKRRRKLHRPKSPNKSTPPAENENKQPSKHEEHELDMPGQRVRAVVRLHGRPWSRGGVSRRRRGGTPSTRHGRCGAGSRRPGLGPSREHEQELGTTLQATR